MATLIHNQQGKIGRPFPKFPLYGAIAVVLFSIAATTFGRLTEIGTVRNPTTSPVDIRDIVFNQDATGALTVTDPMTGDVITRIGANEGGFIPGALRGLNQNRRVRNAAPTDPYRLIRWDDGRLTLSDTATGERYMLDAFGPNNSGAFARLLERRSSAP